MTYVPFRMAERPIFVKKEKKKKEWGFKNHEYKRQKKEDGASGKKIQKHAHTECRL